MIDKTDAPDGYIAVKEKQADDESAMTDCCIGCEFDTGGQCRQTHPCTNLLREDRHNVIFIKEKK